MRAGQKQARTQTQAADDDEDEPQEIVPAAVLDIAHKALEAPADLAARARAAGSGVGVCARACQIGLGRRRGVDSGIDREPELQRICHSPLHIGSVMLRPLLHLCCNSRACSRCIWRYLHIMSAAQHHEAL